MTDPDPQTPGATTPRRRVSATVSLALVAAAVAVVAARPAILGSGGAVADRAFGAILFVGGLGAVLHAAGWRGNRLLRVISHPLFAWSALGGGLAWGLLS